MQMHANPIGASTPVHAISSPPLSSPSTRFGEAEIVDLLEDGGMQVRLLDPSSTVVQVRLAVQGYRPSVGDRVVAVHDGEQGFVVGVLTASSALEVSESGVQLTAYEGDIRVSAPAGRIILEAPTLELEAEQADVHAERLSFRAEQMVIRATEMAQHVGRLQTSAQRIVESAVDVYRDVERSAHTRVHHARTIVEDAYQLFSARTTLVSKEDTVIDGKRIHLG